MKKIILVITATFLLNFVWENAQAVLYQPHGDAWGHLFGVRPQRLAMLYWWANLFSTLDISVVMALV